MPDAPSKLQRWLDLISCLASRRFPVATEDLWRAVPAYARAVDGTDKEKQTVRRMFERDKDELKALGIPIESLRFTVNHYEEVDGYRLSRRDFHLPYLKLLREAGAEGGDEAGVEDGVAAGAEGGGPAARAGSGPAPPPHTPTFELTEAEAGAALEGLRELASVPGFPLARAARSAFRKLAFDLEPGVAADHAVLYAPDPESEAASDALRLLADAARRRKAVGFRYHAMSTDRDEERHVHPYGLLFQHGRWYLVAHDTVRDAIRMFRVGRMRGVSVSTKRPGTPDYEIPDGFSMDAYAGRKAWELGEDEEGPVDASVRFRFPRSLWAERNGHGALVEASAQGDQLRRFVVHRREPFLRWVLSLAGDAWVEAPPALREEFGALAAAVAGLHAAPPPPDTEEPR